MARYALRNQQKISDTFGVDYLNDLLSSLDTYFAKAEYIEENSDRDEPNNFLKSPHEKGFYEFWIINKKYNIYQLALKV